MHTTAALVRALKDCTGIESDYGIAKHLGITKQTLSNYRAGTTAMSPEIALRVAAELRLDPGYVLACLSAERAKRTDEKRVWERVARRMAQAACLCLAVGIVALAGTMPGPAVAAFFDLQAAHYAKSAAAAQVAAIALRLALKRVRWQP